MPLLDHFRPPLSLEHYWDSFYSSWATRIADQLSDTLPPGFIVEEHTHVGDIAEIDVATYVEVTPTGQNGVGTALASPAIYAPPKPTLVAPAVFPDVFEVRVFDTDGGKTLVAAIEIVSPGNKDAPDVRRSFAAKCASYLHQRVAVIVVDLVTTYRANLHNELIRLLQLDSSLEVADGDELYAIAYRPVERAGRAEIDIWHESFALGDALPTMPLRIKRDTFVPVDFESAYMEACRKRRLA